LEKKKKPKKAESKQVPQPSLTTELEDAITSVKELERIGRSITDSVETFGNFKTETPRYLTRVSAEFASQSDLAKLHGAHLTLCLDNVTDLLTKTGKAVQDVGKIALKQLEQLNAQISAERKLQQYLT
jgi:hypothetical protein